MPQHDVPRGALLSIAAKWSACIIGVLLAGGQTIAADGVWFVEQLDGRSGGSRATVTAPGSQLAFGCTGGLLRIEYLIDNSALDPNFRRGAFLVAADNDTRMVKTEAVDRFEVANDQSIFVLPHAGDLADLAARAQSVIYVQIEGNDELSSFGVKGSAAAIREMRKGC